VLPQSKPPGDPVSSQLNQPIWSGNNQFWGVTNLVYYPIITPERITQLKELNTYIR